MTPRVDQSGDDSFIAGDAGYGPLASADQAAWGALMEQSEQRAAALRRAKRRAFWHGMTHPWQRRKARRTAVIQIMRDEGLLVAFDEERERRDG